MATQTLLTGEAADGQEALDSAAEAGAADDQDIDAAKAMAGMGEDGEGEDDSKEPVDMEAMMEMLKGMGGGGMGGMGGLGGMMGGMGGMGGMGMPGMGGMGGMGGGGAPAPDDTAEKAGGEGRWHWQEKGEELQLRIPQETPITKKDVSVTFKRAALKVSIKGEALIDGKLAGTVEVDECTWCIAPGGLELQVMLTKQKADKWPTLLD